MKDRDHRTPILTDNRRFRKDIPAVDRHFKESEKEARKFPMKDGMIVDRSLVENTVDCPICRSKRTGQLFLKWGFLYAQCGPCGHVFVRNRLREEILLSLYAASETDRLDRIVQQSPQHRDYWGKVYRKYLRLLSAHGTGNKNLLDVGCGDGEFLRCCKRHARYALHGVDFAENTYRSLMALVGKENYYFKQKFEDIDFHGKQFRVVTFWGVLEHLSDPTSALRKCRNILDDAGVVLALIPNLHSRAFKILGVNVPTLNPREHFHFFTPKSFSRLCRNTGLSIVDRLQELPVIDLMYDHVSYGDALIKDILEKDESYYHVYLLKKAS
jgi:ubiquinone/menaquinone biosynthesis C-methylase UbiE